MTVRHGPIRDFVSEGRHSLTTNKTKFEATRTEDLMSHKTVMYL
jgi:hypothetical protein